MFQKNLSWNEDLQIGWDQYNLHQQERTIRWQNKPVVFEHCFFGEQKDKIRNVDAGADGFKIFDNCTWYWKLV